MKVVAYDRRESPERRRRDATIRAELAAVRRWAQGLEQLVRDGDRPGAMRQAAQIARGLRVIDRQLAGR